MLIKDWHPTESEYGTRPFYGRRRAQIEIQADQRLKQWNNRKVKNDTSEKIQIFFFSCLKSESVTILVASDLLWHLLNP